MVVGKLGLNADPRGAGTLWLAALWVRKLGAGHAETERRGTGGRKLFGAHFGSDSGLTAFICAFPYSPRRRRLKGAPSISEQLNKWLPRPGQQGAGFHHTARGGQGAEPIPEH